MDAFIGNHSTYVFEMKDHEKETRSNDDYLYDFLQAIKTKEVNLYAWYKREIDDLTGLISRDSFFTMLTSGFKSFDDLSQSLNFTDEVQK